MSVGCLEWDSGEKWESQETEALTWVTGSWSDRDAMSASQHSCWSSEAPEHRSLCLETLGLGQLGWLRPPVPHVPALMSLRILSLLMGA